VPIALLQEIGQTLKTLVDAINVFTDGLKELRPVPLVLGLVAFAVYQLLHSRASFNAVRCAYPDRPVHWRAMWGAYVTAYGLNGVVPAGAGTAAQVMLARRSVSRSTYPAIGAALSTTAIFDGVACAAILVYGFASGFPHLDEFAGLASYDLAWIGNHTALAVVIAAVVIAGIVLAVQITRRRVAGFGEGVRRGLTVLREPRRLVLGMFVPQALSWVARFASTLLLLKAFGMPATAHAAVLVLGAQMVAMLVPLTPGGAGAQQAILFAVFAGAASAAAVTAFSVGQQIVLVAFTLAEAFVAALLIFRTRSLLGILRQSRAERAAASLSRR